MKTIAATMKKWMRSGPASQRERVTTPRRGWKSCEWISEQVGEIIEARRVEVSHHQAKDARDEEKDVDAVERKIPVEHVDAGNHAVVGSPESVHSADWGEGEVVGLSVEVVVYLVANINVELIGVVLRKKREVRILPFYASP